MKIMKFQATKHHQLWMAMKNSWHLVQRFGLTDTKIHIRRSLLNDTEDILNSCYACEYDHQVATQRGEQHRCRYCPIYVDRCDVLCSVLFQMTLAIKNKDEHQYQRLCVEMANAPMKLNVDWE